MAAKQILGSAIKTAAVRSGFLRIASRLGTRKVAILRYHSVLPSPEEFSNSIGQFIIHSEMVFEGEMALIASRYRPVNLDQVCAFARGESDLPRNSVAVTFDDGFADNLDVAAPIMARYGIPATIYLATDYIGNRMPPWYCRLRYAFAVSSIPRWTMEDGVDLEMTVPEQRLQAFLDSSRKCAKLSRKPQEELLAGIEARLEVEPFAIPVMLTWAGVRELLAQGHIIGSHTLSHPNVAHISADDLTDEIASSKSEIEKNTQIEVKHFSYPSPIMEPHYSDETVAATQAAGYESAVTCTRGAVVLGQDTLRLMRIPTPQTLPEFEWAMENIFLGRSL